MPQEMRYWGGEILEKKVLGPTTTVPLLGMDRPEPEDSR